MAEYKGTIELIGGLTPKNNGTFPLASAKDIQVDSEGKRLDARLTELGNTVPTHNTSSAAHSDIRELISGLTSRLNALADSDDTTLDQLSEIVAYIKSNKDLIDAITTSKVNVSDIANDLETNSASKVLSAAQGVAIKALLDALEQKIADGPSITVDSVLSETSENPVQNKAITAALKIPTFDLAAMGLPAIVLGTEAQMLQTDTTAIMAALSKGTVRFIVNMDNGDGTSSSAELTMNSVHFDDGSYVCTYSYMGDVLYTFAVVVVEGTIIVGCVPLQSGSSLPEVSTDDNGKLLQVVDGVWTPVTVENSAIKTYIDSYIDEALGGDY